MWPDSLEQSGARKTGRGEEASPAGCFWAHLDWLVPGQGGGQVIFQCGMP